MKHTCVTLTVLAWMSVCASGVLAAAPKGDNKSKRPKSVPAPYTWMVKDLALTEDQQDKIAEALKAANVEKVTTDLLKSEVEKVAAAEKDLAAAKKEKNAAAIKEANTALVAARGELKAARATIKPKVHDTIEAEIMSGLTAEQKTKWAVHAALPEVQGALKPVTLTQEQVGKVRTLCEEASTALLAAWGSEKADERKAVVQGIVDDVKANILSEQQQRQLPKTTAPKDGSK